VANHGISNRTPAGIIVNKDGTATFAFIKWMQSIGGTVNAAFDEDGAYQGEIGADATIDGRETLATIVQNIDTNGVVESAGIDFARIYINQNIDYIADGAGSPIAGGREAYAVLVASGPITGQTIRFNGTHWLPVAIASTKAGIAKQWIRSYDAATGLFTAAQPDFSDLSGTLNPAQLPANIAYIDAANIFTAIQTIHSNLVVTGTINGVPQAVFAFLDPTSSVQTQLNAKQATLSLTTTGTSGASTLIGATLNVPVYAPPVAQVYPAAGVAVSTGAAWTTSIPAADVARVGSNNNFSANQTINGALTVSGNIVGHSTSGYSFNAATPSAIRIITGATAMVAGTFSITFATPFAAGSVCVLLTLIGGGIGSTPPSVWIATANNLGFTVNASSATATDSVFWAAFGNS
jgi:hypothetical protein